MPEALSVIDATFYNTPGFLLVTLGVLVSIRFAGFPDLTVDGSFTIGAALYALTVVKTDAVLLAYALAAFGGAIGGALTSAVNQAFGIGKIISSVLVMLLLILGAPYLTGGSTVGLLTHKSMVSRLGELDAALTKAVFGAVPFSLHLLQTSFYATLCGIMIWVSYWFFRSAPGIEIRYLGSAKTPTLLPARKRTRAQFIGLMSGNALVALGGGIEAERGGGFHQNMGIGVILIGLAILVLGESLLKSSVRRDQLHVGENLLAIVFGALTYALGVQLLLALDLSSVDVRLATTLFLLVMLAYASRRHPNSARLF
jgi:putative tryptophan/tyrosine transport system permease protein